MDCLKEESMKGVDISHIPAWSSFFEDRIMRDIQEKGVQMTGYFYYKSDELVGYCFIRLLENHTYVMEYMEVKKDYHNRGVGSFIFNRMKSLYAEFIIEAVPGSYHFYLSRGTRPLASHGGGVLLVMSQRSPLVVRKELLPDFHDFIPDDNFIYNREEWKFYDEVETSV